MTDHDFDGGQAAPVSRGVASLTNWIGAALSVGLVLGIGAWGYRIVARDVSGVPVVMAMEGPMRVAPEDPGGRLADHQGLAVNAVAGQGTAEPPADRLVIAPRPAGLAEEDVALGLIQRANEAQVRAASLSADFPALGDDPEIVIPEDSPLATGSTQSDIDAVVASLTGRAPPPAEDAPEDAATESAVAAEDGMGLARSLRPRLRPGGLQTASLDPVLPEASETREIDGAQLAAGTRLVQIGAFDSPEAARAEWARLDTRFDAYLEGKDRVIQKASSGGRVFYRLRAHGFEDLSDARRFCAALVAGSVDCIPVVTR